MPHTLSSAFASKGRHTCLFPVVLNNTGLRPKLSTKALRKEAGCIDVSSIQTLYGSRGPVSKNLHYIFANISLEEQQKLEYANLVKHIGSLIIKSPDWSKLVSLMQRTANVLEKKKNLVSTSTPDLSIMQAETTCRWDAIQKIDVYGLGSLHKSGILIASNEAKDVQSTRAVYRLYQIALSTCLPLLFQNSLGLQLRYADPDFTDFDVSLIETLGGQVIEPEYMYNSNSESEEIHCTNVNGQQTMSFFYMPCCPRDLYAEVIRVYNLQKQLNNLAILGSSLTSFRESGHFFSALCGQKNFQDGFVELIEGSNMTELPCPDFCAHGTGASLHLFANSSD